MTRSSNYVKNLSLIPGNFEVNLYDSKWIFWRSGDQLLNVNSEIMTIIESYGT